MTTPPVTVAPEDALREAAELMAVHGLHHLPVVVDGRLAGLLSATDLLGAARGAQPAPARQAARVGDLMRTRPVTLGSGASLGEAARLLADGGYHALPVVDPSGAVVGMVTSTDLIILLLGQLPARQGPGAGQLPVPDARAGDLEAVCRAAELYLRSGHAEHEHAVLVRALARAREHLAPGVPAGRL